MLFLTHAAGMVCAQGVNPIPDTGQVNCYDDSRIISCRKLGRTFYGQDGHYVNKARSFMDNGDGTITDSATGLMWSKAVDKNKVSLKKAKNIAQKMTLGGHTDWRVPNIKELYSLIDFRGYTGFSPGRSSKDVPANAIPFINTDYFDFEYGDVNAGERYIDAQWLSSTKYVSTTMNGDATLFGVNFADGRIKGYGYHKPGGFREKFFYARYVRGNEYGRNAFKDNGDNTITDQKTGLMWAKNDSGRGMNWQQALEYAENLEHAGYDDWRLPNAKELQYIVDYTRSPDTTGSPAIDPVFQSTSIVNEAGKKDYPYYWTSTTHSDGPNPGKQAAYVAFGRALGKMRGRVVDVHGAGAQRSDPKTGLPTSRGPQGDMVRVNNYIRVVRGGSVGTAMGISVVNQGSYPNQTQQRSLQNFGGQQAGGQQQGRQQTGRPGFVQRLDKDGDGKVSRSEFDGPRDRFGYHDQNNDGYLTESEAPKGPPPGGRKLQQ